MDSWITILLTLVLLIVPSIIKAKKEKDKRAGRPVKSVPWLDQLEKMGQEEEEEDDRYEYEGDEYKEAEPEVEKPEYYQSVPESVPVVVEEGGENRIPTVATDHYQVHHDQEKKNKEKIDVQKLIIYSEIMKPKFRDFDLD